MRPYTLAEQKRAAANAGAGFFLCECLVKDADHEQLRTVSKHLRTLLERSTAGKSVTYAHEPVAVPACLTSSFFLQPDVFASLCQDPAFSQQTLSDAQLMASSMSGATGWNTPADSAMGISTGTMQPLYAAESVDSQMQMASQLLPKDLAEASINNTTFGQGYVTVYKRERPPQGLALLREDIKLPINPTACNDPNSLCFNMPDFGPYGVGYFNQGIGTDPRYQPPVFDQAAGTYKMPQVPNNGPLLAGASANPAPASGMLAP